MKSEKFLLRESLLIEKAKEIIDEQGLLSFKFSDLSRRTGCSAGVVYSHFTNKEDLLLAIQTQNINSQLLCLPSLFNCGLNVAEAWLAITLLPFWYAKKVQLGTGVNVMAELPSLLERASSERRDALMNKLNSSCINIDALLKRAQTSEELSSLYEDISVVKTSVLCIQRGAMAFSDVEICGVEPTVLDGHKFARCLFIAINQLDWKHPLNGESYGRVISQLNLLLK